VPYTLLLADDSVTIQRVIELTFADEDVVVVAVSDGDQAIARLEASPPDIVLADIGMPGKTGYEVAQYIRQSPRLAHIPVVLLTGAFEPVDQDRAAAAGCDGVLAKPFEPQLVIGRVKELLARATRQPEPLAVDSPPPPHVPEPWMPPAAAPAPVASALEPAAPIALDDYFDRLDAAFSNLPSTAAPPAAEEPPPPDIDWFGTTAAGVPATEPWDLPAPADRMESTDLPLTDRSPEAPPSSVMSFAPSPPAELSPQVVPSPEREPSASLDAFAPDDLLALETPAASLEASASGALVPDDAHLAEFAPDAVLAAAPSAPAPAPAPVASAPVASEPAFAPAPAVPAPVAAAPVALARPDQLPALADAFAALLAAEQGEPVPARAPFWPGAARPAPYDTGARPAAAVATDALVDDVTRRVLDTLSDRVIRETVAEIVSKVAEQLVREEIERIKASIK
jgi:CheY-like chemotaxis protein